MHDPGDFTIEMPMYPYVKEISRDETYVSYEVIDSRSGETLAWMEEKINPRQNRSTEPIRKRVKTEHGAAPSARGEELLYDPTSIFVSGLDVRTSKHDLLRHFGSLGQITRVTRLHSNDTGKFNGSAYIQYRNMTSAEEALFLDGSYLKHGNIIVQVC